MDERSPQTNRLPTLVGLCPGEHFGQFYMPLEPGESERCPQPGCEHNLVVYCHRDEVNRRVRDAYDVGREDQVGRRG